MASPEEEAPSRSCPVTGGQGLGAGGLLTESAFMASGKPLEPPGSGLAAAEPGLRAPGRLMVWRIAQATTVGDALQPAAAFGGRSPDANSHW